VFKLRFLTQKGLPPRTRTSNLFHCSPPL
jgi:hypothetical protein